MSTIVRDVMTSPVVSVRRTAPLKDVARLLVEHRISGLPVVDVDGTVLGVLQRAVAENLRTDFGIPEMVDMANTYRSICTEDAITLMRLEGQIATFDDPILQMPLSYVVIDEAEIRRKVASLLEP